MFLRRFFLLFTKPSSLICNVLCPSEYASNGKPQIGARHVQCFMAFLALAISYCLRVNLSVAIVAMTQKSSSSADSPELPWNASMKGTILSSFFWGYILLQIPAGQLGEKFGPKYLLAATLFFCGIVTVLTPIAAVYGGFYWMIVTRVLQGAAQGFLFPLINFLLSKWTPMSERGRLFAMVFNGTVFGILVTMATGGILANSRWGWPSVFYVSGGISILWALVYCYFGANSPQDHRSISDAERDYILNSIPTTSADRKALKTPWKAIITSAPMWAILISHLAESWGYYILLTQIPSYINALFGLNIQKSGYLSALPYASSFVMVMVYAAISDALTNKNILSRTTSKKLWNSIALWGPAVSLFLLAFCGEHKVLALFFLVASLTTNCALKLGYLSNHLDLSPNFSGTLMGITNGFSNITSISGPLFVGYVVSDPKSLHQWKIVFLTSAAIFFIGNLFFIIFGTAEVQPWNFPPEEKAKSLRELQKEQDSTFDSTVQ